MFFDGIEYSADDMITYLGIITTDGVVKGQGGRASGERIGEYGHGSVRVCVFEWAAIYQ